MATNFERIKNMTIEEMLESIMLLDGACKFCSCDGKNCGDYDCEKGIKQWLESESEEQCQMID